MFVFDLQVQDLTNSDHSLNYVWGERMDEMSEFLNNVAGYIHPKELPEKSQKKHRQ